MNAKDLLLGWLDGRLSTDNAVWLRAQCDALAAGAPERALHLAFGQALRRAGREPLRATPSESAAAASLHPGFDLADWTTGDAARAALLLSRPSVPESTRAVLSLFQTADLGEHVALVRALFLQPDAAALLHIAREAIRSNMGDVFSAISQRNPYPAEHFDDIAWNQMIVKCLFVELPLRGVHGIDARANADLARMLAELARERWAAGRAISSEAWRCVAPFADDPAAGHAASVLASALERETSDRRGAALAAWNAGNDRLRALVRDKTPDLVPSLEDGTLNWENHDRP